ncbi:Mini-ribonuclease 3 [Porcipelethomonas sp.]|uniref:Mini-ribonuclease 3 n=1 Tax=Porcipelethomonas sp. TaxID=2981675 RepID=UPI003EFA01CC
MNRQLTEKEVNLYSPLALAFLGDSVYELLVRREILLAANLPAAKLHSLKISRVCASYQAAALEKIMPVLDEKEMAIVKRGRNATGNTVPKHASAADYRKATALECLFGYLHLLERHDRINELFRIIWEMEEFVIS